MKRNRLWAGVLILCLLFFSAGGCGGSDDSHIIQDETTIVHDAYNWFSACYFDANAVREPEQSETLEEYVNSYHNQDDIYTNYFNSAEISNIKDHFASEEILIVRTYGETTLYIAFDRFVEGTAYRVATTINSYAYSGFNNLILDLRVNGGGLVDEAVAVLDYFISDRSIDTPLCHKVTQDGEERYYLEDFSYLYGDGYEDIFDSSTMYVLTSGYTASATEILIAGLKYFNEATQVGSTTFGKNREVWIIYYDRGDGFEMTSGVIYHADGIDRESIGIIPEGNFMTTIPFEEVGSLLGFSDPDPLQDDWEISEDIMPFLYSQDYWRNQVACASIFPSVRMLKAR
ncbi:MAG: S41 family peptidase [bacterium]